MEKVKIYKGDLDGIRHIGQMHGREFWWAGELASVLGIDKLRFIDYIGMAMRTFAADGGTRPEMTAQRHFQPGKYTEDIALSRQACKKVMQLLMTGRGLEANSSAILLASAYFSKVTAEQNNDTTEGGAKYREFKERQKENLDRKQENVILQGRIHRSSILPTCCSYAIMNNLRFATLENMENIADWKDWKDYHGKDIYDVQNSTELAAHTTSIKDANIKLSKIISVYKGVDYADMWDIVGESAVQTRGNYQKVGIVLEDLPLAKETLGEVNRLVRQIESPKNAKKSIDEVLQEHAK